MSVVGSDAQNLFGPADTSDVLSEYTTLYCSQRSADSKRLRGAPRVVQRNYALYVTVYSASALLRLDKGYVTIG